MSGYTPGTKRSLYSWMWGTAKEERMGKREGAE